MSYAIITLGGKQYRVREGERLLVDKLATDEGKTFEPRVLLVGGDGNTDLSPTTTVTARVVGPPARREDPHRQVQEAHRLPEAQRLPQPPDADRDRVDRRREEGSGEEGRSAEGRGSEGRGSEGRGSRRQTPRRPEAAAEAPARTAHPPKGYEDMTVAQIAEAASGWRRPNLEAALEYEHANANRKGAIAALESALAAKEEH